MTAPVRIQRQRTKGWKMPPNTVYVGRPSKWGNPWSASHHDHRHHNSLPAITENAKNPAEAVEKFRYWIESMVDGGFLSSEKKRQEIQELRGKNLACWCPIDQPCHADVLLEIANQESL